MKRAFLSARFLCTLAVLASAASTVPLAYSQTEQVLGERGLQEQDLIDALRKDGIRTRSIRTSPSGAPARQGSVAVMVTFATDSAELSDSARSALDVVARALDSDRLSGLSFSVEGHADPRGTSTHNLTLSRARAEAVIDYLSDTHHIDRARLQAVGRGDAYPIWPDKPAAKENRRVTFVTQ